jgi:hypothetical protein
MTSNTFQLQAQVLILLKAARTNAGWLAGGIYFRNKLSVHFSWHCNVGADEYRVVYHLLRGEKKNRRKYAEKLKLSRSRLAF